jgi:hypothetical protein
MKLTDPSNANGTSLVGHILSTYNKLVQLFGIPNGSPSFDGKVKNEWVLENSDGQVVTIYDWKLSENLSHYPDETYHWHIGAHNRSAAAELLEMF